MATDYEVTNFSELSVCELYVNEEAFRYIMHQYIGIASEQCRTKIVNDGFGCMKDIIQHHPNDVEAVKTYLTGLNKTFASSSDTTLRVYYSPVVINRFAGIIHLYNQAVNTFHTIPDPSFLTRAKADELSNQYNSFRKWAKNETEEVEVEIPKLTGSSNWVDFRDKFKMKLSLTIGNRGFPLEYVIDETDRPVSHANAALVEADDELDLSAEDTFVVKPTLFGKPFKMDNAQVWQILKSQLLGTPVYNHISSCDGSANGRKAYLALKEFYQGEDFQAQMKDAAFQKLTSTFYRGDNARFTFEKYISVHKEAHKMLEDSDYNNGARLDNATKCHHFVSGIKEQAGLEYALSNVRCNPQYRDFVNLISFLSAEVDHRNIRKQQLKGSRDKDRNVSGTERKGKGKSSNKNKNFLSRTVEGKVVYGKRYSRQEFKSLSESQKKVVKQLCTESRKSKKSSSDTGPVSSVTIDDMISVGDAIVAGVMNAASAESESAEEKKSDSSNTSKRKAPAGGVGNFIANRRKSTKSE